MVELFDYIWKPYSLFSKLWVNCLLTFYFVHCNNCALKDVNGACYCTSSLVAPARAWNERLEKARNFEMHTCHWPGAQLWFRHKWRKLVTASLLLICIDGYSCLRYGNEFVSALLQVKMEVFSYCTLTETFAIGIQNWFDHKWIHFCFFFVDICRVSSSSCLHGLKSAKIGPMFFFFDDIKSFR